MKGPRLACHRPGTRLHGDLLQQALDAAHQIADEGSQAHVLTVLAPQVQGDTRHQLLQQALDTARHLGGCVGPGTRAHAGTKSRVTLVTSCQQALDTARQLADEGLRVEVLTELAPSTWRAPPAGAQRARQLTDAWDQARVLITLAPQLHGTLLQQALDAAR
jgi:hypothetical protein